MTPKNAAQTVGSSKFDPDEFIDTWTEDLVQSLDKNDFQTCIKQAFNLPSNDSYVYHAIASVTLQQVQAAIHAGDRNGMHAWYRDEHGKQIEPPSLADIEAYTQIFSPKTTTSKALNACTSNAQRGSLRLRVGQHLHSQIILPDAASGLLMPAKQKNPKTLFKNPYYDLWAWSCANLEWAGPTAQTALTRQSHHILPVLYHHFGCVVPTWDAISLLAQLSTGTLQLDQSSSTSSAARLAHSTSSSTTTTPKPRSPSRPIIDMGSGNGYWTLLLRRAGLQVHAVDNALSAWRTTWLSDTLLTDGVAFLQHPPPLSSPTATSTTKDIAQQQQQHPLGGPGCPSAILLLVYPQVSAQLTARLVRAYKGRVVVVAGTQNGNGYTAFADETIAAWMAREEEGRAWRLVAQVPLPSFAGKDEALFVFVRDGERGREGDGE